jgi:hypothetical protein
MGAASQPGRDTAAVGALPRPPFLYLGCLNLGLVLDHVWPLPLTLPETAVVRGTAGGGLILFGVAIVAAGIRNFARAATPVPSNQPVRALVTHRAFTVRAAIPSMWVSPLCRDRLGRAQPMGPCLHAASCRHPALRRGRARGGLSRAAFRRRLPRLQGACPPLAVAIER